MALEVRGRRGRHCRAGWPALDLAALAEAVLLASGQIGRNIGPIIEELPFVLARPVVDTFHTLWYPQRTNSRDEMEEKNNRNQLMTGIVVDKQLFTVRTWTTARCNCTECS